MSKKKAWEAKGFTERANQSAEDRRLTMSGKKKKPAPKRTSLAPKVFPKGSKVKVAGGYSYFSSQPITFTWNGSGQWITGMGPDTWTPKTLELTTREQIDTLRVFKLAKLVWSDGRIRLQGVGMNIIYDADGVALCGMHEGAKNGMMWMGGNAYGFDHAKAHQVPEPKCSCGFYGVEHKHAEQLQIDYGVARYVRIEAELFGRVVRHERGYRAERQRVLSVSVPRRCRTIGSSNYNGTSMGEAPCDNPSTGLRLDAGDIVPSCAEHAPFGAVAPTDVAKMLGCQVRWFDPAETRV